MVGFTEYIMVVGFQIIQKVTQSVVMPYQSNLNTEL
jgi:hypothetical protein